MTETAFKCARCGRDEPRLTTPPIPGTSGHEIMDKICAGCWNEWTQAEVMVINELRLNFMDPKSLEILEAPDDDHDPRFLRPNGLWTAKQ